MNDIDIRKLKGSSSGLVRLNTVQKRELLTINVICKHLESVEGLMYKALVALVSDVK